MSNEDEGGDFLVSPKSIEARRLEEVILDLQIRQGMLEQVFIWTTAALLRKVNADDAEPQKRAQNHVILVREHLFSILKPEPDETQADEQARETYREIATQFFERLEIACLE